MTGSRAFQTSRLRNFRASNLDNLHRPIRLLAPGGGQQDSRPLCVGDGDVRIELRWSVLQQVDLFHAAGVSLKWTMRCPMGVLLPVREVEVVRAWPKHPIFGRDDPTASDAKQIKFFNAVCR